MLNNGGTLGLLDWNLLKWERYICDDDITYLNSIAGSYIFNSEFLWNSQAMPNAIKDTEKKL